MIIPKGCTVVNTFVIPFTEDDIEVMYITYQQYGTTIVEKTLPDCTFADNKILVGLSQEDTLRFHTSYTIDIQIRIRLKNGVVTKSKVVSVRTDELLKTGVI